MLPSDFTTLDYAAVGWYLACWIGYTIFADHSPYRRHSMTAVMSGYRHRWMLVMLGRENRVVDTTIIGNLLNGAAFFASTTIFAIGGLLAALGATDSAIEILQDLPLAVTPSRAALELKMLLLVTSLVFAFFKFAWAFRLFNYCSVLIGAVPLETVDNPEAEKMAGRAANVNSAWPRATSIRVSEPISSLSPLSAGCCTQSCSWSRPPGWCPWFTVGIFARAPEVSSARRPAPRDLYRKIRSKAVGGLGQVAQLLDRALAAQ